jgi:pimeloyl-ACP methyl ester carboxylesterase
MPEVELRGGEVDGLSLHYVVEGRGPGERRGPAIVLVHGLGGFAESWRYTIAALAKRATVYAVDLPGFGQSAKSRGPYRLASFARALHGFIEALGLGRVSLVGHSLGGAVCVTYALTHPVRVERMALVGSVVPGFPYQFSLPARAAALPVIGELAALCGCAPLYKASIARCFATPIAGEVDFLVDSFYAARTSAEARAAFLATLRHVRADLIEHLDAYRRALATLDLPIMLIHGRDDRVVSPSHCAAAAAGLTRAGVKWVERCGHFPHIEHAETVNGWLAQFLIARPAPR